MISVNSTSVTLATYCADYERGDLAVNRDYQRSDRVWPQVARSYLIESLIMGFPLPKFTLYLETDLKSKKTKKEIVDGQQRSQAIFDYYMDRFSLSASLDTIPLRGKLYSELDPEYQQAFLSAKLTIDELITASRPEVRDAFRRMNSYTIPLNPEEHRHAHFQGPMKWFVTKLAKRFNEHFVDIGVFREKQIIRMEDTKLIAEICDALLSGIRTTSKNILDRLYRERNEKFEEEGNFQEWISVALDEVLQMKDIHRSDLMKPYVMYSLLLAIIHVRFKISSLEKVINVKPVKQLQLNQAVGNLLVLNGALDENEEDGARQAFVLACKTRTNVKDQRETRFRWMVRALLEKEI